MKGAKRNEELKRGTNVDELTLNLLSTFSCVCLSRVYQYSAGDPDKREREQGDDFLTNLKSTGWDLSGNYV